PCEARLQYGGKRDQACETPAPNLRVPLHLPAVPDGDNPQGAELSLSPTTPSRREGRLQTRLAGPGAPYTPSTSSVAIQRPLPAHGCHTPDPRCDPEVPPCHQAPSRNLRNSKIRQQVLNPILILFNN